MTIKLVLLAFFYFAFPLVIIHLCRRWTLLKKLGTIVLAYIFGILLGSSGIFPEGSDGYALALQGNAKYGKVLESLISKEGRASDILVNKIG